MTGTANPTVVRHTQWLRVLVGMSVGIALFVAHVESRSFLASGIAGLVGLFLVPFLGVTLAVCGLRRRRRSVAAWGGTLLLAAALSLAAGAVFSAVQRAESMARGDRLCAALERHRVERGSYPQRLEDLVPDFIASVPPTGMGILGDSSFHYRRVGGDDFLLRFEAPTFMSYTRSARGGWRSDD